MSAPGPFHLDQVQHVRRSVEDVFGFFSDPRNLEMLTPPWLKFRILDVSTPDMGEGTTIDYSLRVHGIPLRWRSLISEWNPPHHFVDEQVRGPFRSWVHRHSFGEVEQGVEVRDRVEYSVPGGALVNRLFVKRDLNRIFDHRRDSLAELLVDDPRWGTASTASQRVSP